MNTRSMISKLQKQAHAAELKAISAKHKVTVAQVRRDLGNAVKDLRDQMKREEKTVGDAVPTRAVAKRSPRKAKSATVDVKALLAAAKRK